MASSMSASMTTTTMSSSTSASSSSASTSKTYDDLGAFPTAVATSTSSSTPSGSSTPDSGFGTMTNYYWVFLAIILCVAAVFGVFLYRRRMAIRRGMQTAPASEQWGVQGAWHGYSSRRYRNDGTMTGIDGAEEGLNEDGEAPPPYRPKSDEASGRQPPQVVQTELRHDGPAIELQSVSRRDARPRQNNTAQVTARSSNEPMPPSYDAPPPAGQPANAGATPPPAADATSRGPT